MKLFLASAISKTISLLDRQLLAKNSRKSVLFISNASDIYTGEKPWLDWDRDAFKGIGCTVVDVNLEAITPEELAQKMKSADVIHFCGGSVLYLNNLIKNKKFDSIIIDEVKNGNIIYTGSSAGSMIVARDLSFCAFDQDEKDIVAVTSDFSGLSLVDFLIMPHASNEDFIESNTQVIKMLPRHPQPLLFIDDNQAIVVNDSSFEIVTNQ